MRKRSISGFTLIEFLVASIIGVFIAIVAVGTLKAVSLSSEMINKNIDSASELRFGAKTIENDLVNFFRSNFENTKFQIDINESETSQSGRLIFYTVSRNKVRINEPEGDVYEVEYYLLSDEDKGMLFRRAWPNPDKESQPGGVLSVIAEDVDFFQVRAFDGENWQSEWGEEDTKMPELVEIVIAKGSQYSKDVVYESFIVSFANEGGGDIGEYSEEAVEGIDEE